MNAARRFYKMSGSGNDFIVFDARQEPPGTLIDQAAIRQLCARGTGIGADGIVFLEPPRPGDSTADFRMRYFNSDGSAAEMCGNAALCVTRLAPLLGAASATGMRFQTDSGVVSARMLNTLPEIDLAPVTDVLEDTGIPLEQGELRIGFARVGNPHLVVLRTEFDSLDVVRRGRQLRLHNSLHPAGANVNFVTRLRGESDGYGIRTYERGVEGETLACGTGSMAAAILLAAWGDAGLETTLSTRSGLTITGRLRREGPAWYPTLRGQGRLVFTGELATD